MLSARLSLLAGVLAGAGAAACAGEPQVAGVAGRGGPCAGVLVQPAAPAPGVRVAATCVYYDVTGETAQALADSMDARGPKDDGGDYHAYTAFDLSYGYDERLGEGSCNPRSIVVLLRLTHVLPALEPGLLLERGLAAQWDTFKGRLAVHEAGHARLDVEAALRLEGALAGLLPEASCAALREKAHAAFAAAVAELRREHRFYDMRTGHGKAQGARFP